MIPRVRNEIERRRSLEEERALRLRAWPKGSKPGPSKLMYFPTNACNMSCSICWQRRGVHDYAELSPDRQRDLIAEALDLGVREFVFGGGGEPLLRWRRLAPLFEAIRAQRGYGMLFTNGTLISSEVAAALVDMEWNKVLVSLDGLESVNDTIRGKGSFDRIVRGLDSLLEERGDRELPVIGIGCAMTRHGVPQIPELVRFLIDRGCDQLNLIRLVVYLEEQRPFAIPQEEIGKLQEVLKSAFEIATQGGIVTNLGDYLDRELVTEIESFESVLLGDRTHAGATEPFWDALCFEPFSNMVVHANGAVGPCCMSGDQPAASVAVRSLADVWYGEEFTALRDGIINRCPESYCHICDLNVFAENQRIRSLGVGVGR